MEWGATDSRVRQSQTSDYQQQQTTCRAISKHSVSAWMKGPWYGHINLYYTASNAHASFQQVDEVSEEQAQGWGGKGGGGGFNDRTFFAIPKTAVYHSDVLWSIIRATAHYPLGHHCVAPSNAGNLTVSGMITQKDWGYWTWLEITGGYGRLLLSESPHPLKLLAVEFSCWVDECVHDSVTHIINTELRRFTSI